MTLQTTALAALASIRTALPDCVVTVTNGGNTASCVRSARRREGGPDDTGFPARDVITVYGAASDLGTVVNGTLIDVDGEACEVIAAATDPTGGVTSVQCAVLESASGVRP